MTARRRTTTQRGLGWEHQQARAAALATLVPGSPCPFCREPMFAEHALDYDHAIPRLLGGDSGPRRLAHASCNRRAGRALQARLLRLAARCPSCRAAALDSTSSDEPRKQPPGAFERFFGTDERTDP